MSSDPPDQGLNLTHTSAHGSEDVLRSLQSVDSLEIRIREHVLCESFPCLDVEGGVTRADGALEWFDLSAFWTLSSQASKILNGGENDGVVTAVPTESQPWYLSSFPKVWRDQVSKSTGCQEGDWKLAKIVMTDCTVGECERGRRIIKGSGNTFISHPKRSVLREARSKAKREREIGRDSGPSR